uniref:DUF7041 domain-containing protein n=1 Tax=Trichuris muris TaxID=70415 RepID=A0A5S6QGS0_TRIMR
MVKFKTMANSETMYNFKTMDRFKIMANFKTMENIVGTPNNMQPWDWFIIKLTLLLCLYIGDPIRKISKKGNSPLPPSAPATGPGISQSLVATPLSVPCFLPTDPELWFARLDLFFRHRHVYDEETKFELALSAMPEDTLGILRDFLLTVDLEAAPFTALKAVCLNRLIEDRNHRIRQALSGEELAGRSPSVFLRRLQQLLPAASTERDELVIRQLFLSRLPRQVQVTLLPFEDKPLPELARIADRVMTLHEPSTSFAPVFATTHELAARVDFLEERVRSSICMPMGPPAIAAPHL